MAPSPQWRRALARAADADPPRPARRDPQPAACERRLRPTPRPPPTDAQANPAKWKAERAAKALKAAMAPGWFSSVKPEPLEAAIRNAQAVGLDVAAAMQKLRGIAPAAAKRLEDETVSVVR